MKKSILVLVLIAFVTVGAFAQGFFLDAHYSYGSQVSNLAFGVGYDMGGFDILANIELNFYGHEGVRVEPYDQNVYRSATYFLFGIFAGIAPKFDVSDNVTIAFPILGKIIFYNYDYKYSNYITNSTVTSSTFGIDAGARAYYALNDRFSVYTGFQICVFDFDGKDNYRYSNGSTSEGTATYFRILHRGSLDFGIKFNL